MAETGQTTLLGGMEAGEPPRAGATWAVRQAALGFPRLGHDVYVVEPIKPPVNPASAAYFHQVVRDSGLDDRAALLVEGTGDTIGLSYDALLTVSRRANVLVNVSGMLTDSDLISTVPVRAYLDLDPAFVQVWHAQGIDMRFNEIGRASCRASVCS